MWKDSLESHNAFIIIIIIPFSSFIIKTLTPRSIGKPGRLLGSTQHPNFSFYSRTTLSAEKSNYHAFCRYMQYCINQKISILICSGTTHYAAKSKWQKRFWQNGKPQQIHLKPCDSPSLRFPIYFWFEDLQISVNVWTS